MTRLGVLGLLALGFLTVTLPAVGATRPDVDQLGTQGIVEIVGTRMIDLDGNLLRFGLEDGLKPVALVFLETTCVISKRYAPELVSFAQHAEQHGLEFYAVVSEPNISASELRDWRKDYAPGLTMVFDASGDLAMRLRPQVVPEAIIVGKDDTVLYRGRIDNRFAAVGKLRNTITSHDLKDAMTVIGAGALPKESRTQHVGCAFEAWTDDIPETVTYTRDIEPILRSACSDCHQPGNVAPFPLQTYQDARRRAKMMAKVVADDFMPPWWVRPGHGQFWAARTLSDRQKGLLAQWAKSGAPEGDPADRLPRPEPTAKRGRSTPPTLTVQTPDFELPATGEDVYRYFVFPAPEELSEDTVFLGASIEAGDPEVVHHVDYFIDHSGRARELDEQDPEPGFSVFGTGSFLSYFDGGFLGAWAPGGDGPRERRTGDRERVGQLIKGGGDLVMEIHYHLSGKKTVDNTSMSLYLDEPGSVDRYIGTLFAGTTDVDIPAGAQDYVRHFWMDIPADVDIFNVAAHMHYLGQDVSAIATFPDGTQRSIFQLDRWDFRWQSAYSYLEPIRLPAGSRLDFWYRFDNSENNFANPFDPPVRATWGWDTDQEMAEVYLTAAAVENENLDRLRRSAYASWSRPATPGYEIPIDLTDSQKAYEEIRQLDLWSPQTSWTLRTLASLAEPFDRVIERFAAAADQQGSAEAHAQHGLMLLSSIATSISNEGRADLRAAAAKAFDRALAVDPTHWGARFNKANALRRAPEDAGLWEEAAAEFRKLIELQEQSDESPREHALTYVNLGDVLTAMGQSENAHDVWQRGAERFPDSRRLQSKLEASSTGD